MLTIQLRTIRHYASKLTAGSLLALVVSTPAFAAEGVITLQSAHSVATTVDRLEAVLTAKGMTVFKRVDHAAGAAKAGLQMPATEVLVFGNPKVGTPLMLCAPTAAIDLPQKALVRQDSDGKVWISYNDPKYIAKRHGAIKCPEVIAKITNALNNFVSKAAASN